VRRRSFAMKSNSIYTMAIVKNSEGEATADGRDIAQAIRPVMGAWRSRPGHRRALVPDLSRSSASRTPIPSCWSAVLTGVVPWPAFGEKPSGWKFPQWFGARTSVVQRSVSLVWGATVTSAGWPNADISPVTRPRSRAQTILGLSRATLPNGQ